MKMDFTEIYCHVDDFYKGFESWYNKAFLTCHAKKLNKECKVNLAEIITVLKAFHQTRFLALNIFT